MALGNGGDHPQSFCPDNRQNTFPPDVSCPGGLILLGTENELQLRFSPWLRLTYFWQKILGEHGCEFL